MNSLQRNDISHGSILYKSLGDLVKDYRQWKKLSQEELAQSIGISVRALQNWEANNRFVRIDNLHDLAEATGIPLLACIALNADQPIWYSLQRRRYAFSSVETKHFHEFLMYHGISGNSTFSTSQRISTDKHISKILSCHREIYCTDNTILNAVIKKASVILPDLNQIYFDPSGHYIGHRVCLPLRMDVYQELKKQQNIEQYLTLEKLSDIIALQEGAFFYYSSFYDCLNVAQQTIRDGARFLVKVAQKENYMLAQYAASTESKELFKYFGMKIADDWVKTVRKNQLYEIKLNTLLAFTGPSESPIKEQRRIAETKESMIDRSKYHASISTISNSAKHFHEECLDRIALSDEALTVERPYEVLTVADSFLLPSSMNRRQHRQTSETSYSNGNPGVCPNPKCGQNGLGEGRIVSHGSYRSKDGVSFPRFRCKKCGKSFCGKADTLFYGLRSPESKVLEAFKLLVKGMPLRRVAVALGIELRTVRHWLNFAFTRSDKINAALSKALGVSQFELDALWSSVRKGTLRRRAILWHTSNSHLLLNKD